MSFESQPLDEGYSEAPLSTGNGDGGIGSNSGQETLPVQELPSWIGTLSPQEQIAYVMNILNSIPTSQVSQIVERLRPRLFINFFQKLPPEVCLKILGYLDPVSLIHTALASSEWRRLAMDRKLWEHLYYLEGFRVLPTEVLDFENSLATRLQLGTTAAVFQQTSQRSPQPLQLDGDSEMIDADSTFVSRPPHISGQSSLFGPSGSRNQENQPPSIAGRSHKQMGNARRQDSKEDAIMTDVSERRSRSGKAPATWESDALAEVTKSRLVALDRSNMQEQPQPKLDWQRLYSLRRKLEANWEAEKYTNFQLPHPHYPADGHRECIYTIQYSGQYLVSGSRDKTLRVWDLNTQRLVYEPLKGHAGSVLCLQFDANRATDLIVSGSSDATICLWRFSTGKLIQRIRRAHHESVLNVRFDDNVLVTCSKDKTIKIFNRHPLLPGDAWYPRPAEAVNPVPTNLMNYGFNPTPTSGLPVKPPYSIIAVLEGHGAAVNAVQIFGNQVVSASGDRTIKVWDWPDQTCVRTLIGHTKGIACVQYDGRRIVSGSSDNEVKVFDKYSGLEVASLRAHSDLVRTVQAGFGDLPYSVEEDKEDAKLIDNEYFKAVDEGKVSRNMDLQRGRSRNAGSRRPEDITAYGAKLPPGGGGGKFGRIVSGSYDGTIIIWRRDKEGVWKAQHTLRQEDGALAAQRAQGTPPATPATNLHQTPTIQLPAPIVPTNAALQGANQPMNHAPAQAAIQAMQAVIQAGPAPAQQNAAPIAPPAALHHHHHHGHRAVENYRVFKLQFDARRIISCSQTPTIVGWDFANGDKEIIEASRFFAPIE